MFIGTHICLPLIAAGLDEWRRVGRGEPPLFTRIDLFLIGLGGLSPDILSPHLGLAARHASLSHTFWFPLGMLVLWAATGIFASGRRARVAFFALLGVVMHLFCDLIAGGIPLLGVERGAIGAYWVHPAIWLHCDLAGVLVTWFVFFRVRFLAAGRRAFPTTCSWEERILKWWEGGERPDEGTRLDEGERLIQAVAPAPVVEQDGANQERRPSSDQ